MEPFLLASLLWSAQPPGGLSWEAPPECGSVEALSAKVEALAAEGSGDLWRGAHARAQVELRGGLYHARVELETSEGKSEHAFSAATCEDIVEVVALETAMMLDAIVAVGRVEIVEVSGEAEAVEASEPPPPEPTTEPGRARRVGGRLMLLGGASLGQPEAVAGAFGLAGAVDLGAFRFAVTAGASTPEFVSHYAFPEEGAKIMTLSGALDACFVPGRGRVSVPLCLGVEAGAFRARGEGLDNVQTRYRPHLAPRIGTGVEFEATEHLSVVFSATTPLLTLRPSFEINGLGELYIAPVASLRLLAGLHLRWGP